MKNNKLTKIFLTIASVVLCLGAAFAISAFADETAGNETSATEYKLDIFSQNIEIGDQFRLAYAVDAKTFENTDVTAPVTLKVYSSNPEEGSGAVIKEVSTSTVTQPEGNLTKAAYILKPDIAISMTALTTEFYVQAVDAAGNESAVKRYSVAEYLYQRLATDTAEANPTAKQRTFYESVIQFGANAQLVKNEEEHNNNEAETLYDENSSDLVSNWRYVKITDGKGKLDGYFSAGVYPIGRELKITSAETGSITWTVTTTTVDGEGNRVSTPANKTAVIVEDAIKTEIKFGKSVIITHTEGYRDLDDITPDADFVDPSGEGKGAWNYWQNNSSGFTKNSTEESAFTTFEGRGTVIYGTSLGKDAYVYATPDITGKTYNAETSTAFEISFDVKIMTSGDASDAFRVTTYDTGRKRYIDFYQYDENGQLRDTLLVQGYNKGENGTIESKEFDVNPSGWFHVRMVVYGNDSNAVYIYINGDDANYLRITRENSTVTFASLSRGIFGSNDGDNNDSCYIDNIFVGFTTEENPWKAEQ